eukprot:sb/3465347/
MLLLLFVLLVPGAASYNVDTIDPILLQPPPSAGGEEYFGYSAAIQRSGEARSNWVLVGAPKANATLPGGQVGVGWGAVYNCTEERCDQVTLEKDGVLKKGEVKEGQYCGSTISTDRDTSDAVVCAHKGDNMLLLLFVLLVPGATSYNVDIIDPILLQPPPSAAGGEEYFGYSAAIQRSGEARSNWVLVGAPKANATLPAGQVGVGWGAVYNCTEERCDQVTLEKDGVLKKGEVKEGQYCGSTISTDRDTSDAVVCAHKCSAGISSSYTGRDHITVGGAGFGSWTGRAIIYDTNTKSNIESPEGKPFIGARALDYFGYSQASCYDKSTKQTFLFVGAPRANFAKGRVDYLHWRDNSTHVSGPFVLANYRGTFDIGGYAGAAVACGATTPNKNQVSVVSSLS